MPTTVLFNSLDHTPVSEQWLAGAGLPLSDVGCQFVDCAGLPFYGDQVGIPTVVAQFARAVHASRTVVVALPMGAAGACGVFATAVMWLSRKEICHVMRGKRVVVQMGMVGHGPTEWPTELLRDLKCVGAVCDVRTALATPVPLGRPPLRLDDWVGRLEAKQVANG